MVIPKNKPPTLNAKLNKWSKDFNQFIAQCLNKDPTERPRCMAALQHDFMTNFNRQEAKAELQQELQSYSRRDSAVRGLDWKAPDVRQESVKVNESAVRTMVLERGRGNVPISKEAGYGRNVRVSDNLAGLGELDEAAIVYHLNARYVTPTILAIACAHASTLVGMVKMSSTPQSAKYCCVAIRSNPFPFTLLSFKKSTYQMRPMQVQGHTSTKWPNVHLKRFGTPSTIRCALFQASLVRERLKLQRLSLHKF